VSFIEGQATAFRAWEWRPLKALLIYLDLRLCARLIIKPYFFGLQNPLASNPPRVLFFLYW